MTELDPYKLFGKAVFVENQIVSNKNLNENRLELKIEELVNQKSTKLSKSTKKQNFLLKNEKQITHKFRVKDSEEEIIGLQRQVSEYKHRVISTLRTQIKNFRI